MVEAVAENQICAKCGSDVRENTAFCYNCGESVLLPAEVPASANGSSGEADDPRKAALDELAEKFKLDPDEDDRLAKAAAERRKARVSNRKSTQYEWQPIEDTPNRLFILITLVIVVLAAFAVIMTVFWK